jgi:lariat debranching enzyme
LTIFVGGNHEASNYLQELPYGGWVAPNIYYMGYAGVVTVNNLRIGGISGIFKGYDYHKGHHEYSPYDRSSVTSVFHVRQLEVFRCKQISSDIDVFVSHDWPRGVYNYGNWKQLVKFKPHFADEIEENKLGSPACEELLNCLKPTFWFAAHLHCKFSAIIPHHTAEANKESTKFLALDKCLPKRRFLQFLDIGDKVEADATLCLYYDLEWLTILSLTNHLLSVKKTQSYMPGRDSEERSNFTPSDEEKELVMKKFDNNLMIPKNFVRTVEPYDPEKQTCMKKYGFAPKAYINPQTTEFCDKLNIDDPLSLAMLIAGDGLNHSTYTDDGNNKSVNNESIHLEEGEDFDGTNLCDTLDISTTPKQAPSPSSLPTPQWIVDTKPFSTSLTSTPHLNKTPSANRSMLNLPTPKFDINKSPTSDSTLKADDELEGSEIESKGCGILETVAIAETTLASFDRDSSPPPSGPKKFKRRNQDLYANNDEN